MSEKGVKQKFKNNGKYSEVLTMSLFIGKRMSTNRQVAVLKDDGRRKIVNIEDFFSETGTCTTRTEKK